MSTAYPSRLSTNGTSTTAPSRRNFILALALCAFTYTTFKQNFGVSPKTQTSISYEEEDEKDDLGTRIQLVNKLEDNSRRDLSDDSDSESSTTTATTTIEKYPLKDISNYPTDPIQTSINHPSSWYNDKYSDMSQCIDFQCSSDIELCDNIQRTNYAWDDNATPPCCTHILRDMLRTFDVIMATLGLDYFIGFGTLLGLIRSGRVIPWTIDNDIVIENVQTLRAMTELWPSNSGLQFIFPKGGRMQRGFPRMCITSDFVKGRLRKWIIPTPTRKVNGAEVDFPNRGFPYIDFYFGSLTMQHEGQTIFGEEYQGCRHYYTDIFPTQRQPVYQGQFELNLPAKPEALLERYYGMNWRIPKTDNSQHGEFHQICAVNYGLEDLS
jgi:hypothetical protein